MSVTVLTLMAQGYELAKSRYSGMLIISLRALVWEGNLGGEIERTAVHCSACFACQFFSAVRCTTFFAIFSPQGSLVPG